MQSFYLFNFKDAVLFRKACLNPQHPFFKMPSELMEKIINTKVDEVFSNALHYAAFGKLNELQLLLDQHPNEYRQLFLQRGDVLTPAGLLLEDKTLLECAITGGDPELVEMMKLRFLKFNGGVEKMDIQLARCRPCVETAPMQKPINISWFVDVLKKSSAADVTAVRQKNTQYESDLSHALQNVIKELQPETLYELRMQCNYATLLYLLKLLYDEWDALSEGVNYDKCNVLWRIIGEFQKKNLPPVDRFAYANGFRNLVTYNLPLKRNENFSTGGDSFESAPLGDEGAVCGVMQYLNQAELSVADQWGLELITMYFAQKFERLKEACSPVASNKKTPSL